MSTKDEAPVIEKLSFSDMTGSLTGYEEVAIEEYFKQTIGKAMSSALSKAGRCLIFINEQRNGAKPAAAYKTAMSLRLHEVNDRFLDINEDADDFDPDDPDTDQGKDEEPFD